MTQPPHEKNRRPRENGARHHQFFIPHLIYSLRFEPCTRVATHCLYHGAYHDRVEQKSFNVRRPSITSHHEVQLLSRLALLPCSRIASQRAIKCPAGVRGAFDGSRIERKRSQCPRPAVIRNVLISFTAPPNDMCN